MSTQPSSNQKQPPSVYTVMLMLSMLFLLIAVIAMIVELGRWGPDYYRTPNSMVVPAIGDAPATRQIL